MYLELFFFTLHIFNFFYLRINKPNIHNNITGISSFQTGFNELFSSTGFCFKSKVTEASHKGKNMFFNFWALLLKCTFSRLWKYFCGSVKISQDLIFAIMNYCSSHFMHSFFYRSIKLISISRLKFGLDIFNIAETKRSEQYFNISNEQACSK